MQCEAKRWLQIPQRTPAASPDHLIFAALGGDLESWICPTVRAWLTFGSIAADSPACPEARFHA
jgi:hypothetical protein